MLSRDQIFDNIKIGKIKIDPFKEQNLRVCSYDVSVGRIWKLKIEEKIDTSKVIEVTESNFIILPKESVIIETLEIVKISNDIVGIISPRSKISRLLVFSYSLLIDPGYEGKLSLHVFNPYDKEVILYPEQRIAQVMFWKISECPSYMYLKGSLNVQQKDKISGFLPDENGK